jgi:HEAT repeat protein
MSGFVQLDLFGDHPNFDRPLAKLNAPEDLSDDALISAIPDVALADAVAVAAEVGKRRLILAVPALTSLCDRFVGYGASAVVPEQIAALRALGAIGSLEATQAVSRLITRRIVQGPTLSTALTVASQLGAVLPSDVALNLLRDPQSSVRSAACGCVRPGYEVIAALVTLIDDPDREVAIASACALGRMGRIDTLPHLKRYLMETPSRRIVEALASVADEEAIVFLVRTGRARRELTDSVISALEEIENPRARVAAKALKEFASQAD